MSNHQQQGGQLTDASGEIVKERFFNFLKGFHEMYPSPAPTGHINSNAGSPILRNYPEQITNMIKNDKATVFVDYFHLNQADPELAEAIILEFYRFETYLRKAIQDFVRIEHQEYVHDVEKGLREFFVSVYNLPRVDSIREIHTDRIGRLVAITGTVTRSSEVRPELILATFSCAKCGAIHEFVEQQCQFSQPPICRNSQCSSREFQLLPDQSTFVDWQTLRVQENADEIPAGSMPRCIDVICRNEIVESAKAGDKIVFSGTVLVVPDTSGLARVGESTVGGKSATGRGDSASGAVTGLKKLGVKEMTYRMIFVACAVQHADHVKAGGGDALLSQIYPSADQDHNAHAHAPVELTEAEKAEILRIRNSPKLYSRMAESVCPNVFGHPEIKRGILLMLFGGVHKTTPEGISLRGDLNVCIIGDPSTAKSQFLKYVHSFLSRAIYTSGKASSAAGLTASVVKDSETGEFCIEAGALMLADNAICCIDEFDKMDPADQVAIHEAMEQQTISITKAGIQATLNARTSILAAANPVFGRYDRSKTLKANVAVSAPIMSRFDLFFIILDECNPKVDESISRHIIEVHRRGGAERASQAAPFSTDQLRRYIQFARTLDPIINEEGRKTLVECYRLLRQNDLLGKNKTAYRITVRQLESLIRLSEALARLHLDEVVRPMYIREAYRLLQQSIIFVESEDIELDDENLTEMEEVPSNTSATTMAQAQASTLPSETAAEEESQTQSLSQPQPQDTEGGQQKQQREESQEAVQEAEAQGERDDQQPPLKKARKEKKVKGKTLLSAELYRSMTSMLGLLLKAKQEQAQDAEDAEGDEKGGGYGGCRWGDLVTAYLAQCQNEISDSDSFDSQRKLVNQVIRRMVKHEETLIEISPSDDTPVEDRLLILSPSFDI